MKGRSVAISRPLAWILLAFGVSLGAADVSIAARSLADELGRNEVRIYSQPLRLSTGDSVSEMALSDRLQLRGYRRVHRRPSAAGEYFWGFENFWIYRLPADRVTNPLVQLELERPTARIQRLLAHPDVGAAEARVSLTLEPVLLAESLTEERATRELIDLDQVPDYVWESVLAIEDARFFAHGGVDPRSVARAMLKNARAGRVEQGGSTITQQLVKMRDLSPRRTMGRKVSEAVRALALEAEFDKRDILTAYLDAVYLGHVDGIAVHGFGAASRAYFSKSADQLSLGEAALLAAMVQGPNRLHPQRHGERALARQKVVLDRLLELGWATRPEVERARRDGMPKLRISKPVPRLDRRVLGWLRESVVAEAPRRADDGKGFVIHTSLDPLLQQAAEEAVLRGLRSLRRQRPKLEGLSLSAALVALDGRTGDVLAYVGGDPARRDDSFDRARGARRQPGSAVKPFVLLEAVESCGSQAPLSTSRRVLDRPLEINLPSGQWRPRNTDGRFRGPVTIRRAMVESLNVPFVRIARHCGFEATSRRFSRAGLSVPLEAPPSFVLGAVEVSPLEMASAYTVFSTLGDRLRPRLLTKLSLPSGRRVYSRRLKRTRVVRPSTAYLVRDLLRQVVEEGTASRARIGSREVIGKTGTSSERRDAWFVGTAGSIVTSVWVGVDSGESLGVGGGQAAAPIWRAFMSAAAPARPPLRIGRPVRVTERWIDPDSGLAVRRPGHGAELHLFRRGDEPPRKRLWRREPIPVIE
jgi:membrane peptidoglycan carboxypeptidase